MPCPSCQRRPSSRGCRLLALHRLIITRDRHIQEHRAEIAAVKSSGARMVTLAGAEAVNTFCQLEALMCNWRQILGLLERPGPFIFIANRTTMREFPM